ncbi:MAG: hypothetical protein AAB899_04820, partial [Patescibacteria group bacterium]
MFAASADWLTKKKNGRKNAKRGARNIRVAIWKLSVMLSRVEHFYKVANNMLTSNIQKTIVLLGIIAFVTVGILGIGNFGMMADANGQMSNCPFMGVTA